MVMRSVELPDLVRMNSYKATTTPLHFAPWSAPFLDHPFSAYSPRLQSSRVEILNDGGYRSDGRRQYELRDISIDLSQQGTADGSAIITHASPRSSSLFFGPREAKMRSQTLHDRAVLNVEMSVLPFSTGERRKRSRADRRILELASTIKSTFEPVVQTNLYPRSQIDIFVQVLQQDGGLLQACINATTLALVTAGIPLLDFVCAVTGGVHSTAPMLDLTTLEENDLPHVTVAVMPHTKKVTLVTMETRLHVDRFADIFKLACEAGQTVHKEMRRAVKDRTSALVGAIDSGLKHATGEAVERDGTIEDRMNDF
ncbi:Exosome complex component RRP41 [Grifola frondosa]|uniref:Ribosomal RNA-processing protein 41 n=1 Tax=Grifola frondosa TaxID=5627 RepID=A0A1C7M747_GRIFR|nr:Exosome complex component RRP41 [Grifola frondosa]